MSKKPVQPQDKYVLRLPDGLRDRIKAKSELHGRSMNTEIVRVLEREFPEPLPLDSRLRDLLGLFNAVRKVRGHEGAINELTDGLLETVEGIVSGRVPDIDGETQKRVRESLDEWHLEQAENARDRKDAAEQRYLSNNDGPDFPD